MDNQTLVILIAVFNFVSMIFIGLLVWIFTTQIKRIDNVESENKKIKENYLSRFEDIKDVVNTTKDELKELFHSLKQEVIKISK